MHQPSCPYDTLRDYFRQHLSLPESQLLNLGLWVYGLFKAQYSIVKAQKR